MQIEDGTGTGYKAKITSENKLLTQSLSEFMQYHLNQVHEEMYSMVVSKTPTGAGDCFLYIKNTSDDDLVIFKFKGYALSLIHI